MTEVQERRKKTVEASMTEQVHLIMQQHLNGGGRLFGGALMQWLDEMEQHEDIAVRGGVKLAREYASCGDISGGNCGSGQSSVQACDL